MTNRYIKIIFIVVPLMGVALFSFNNCARYNQLSDSSSSSDSSSLGSTAPGDDVNSEKLGLPYALLSAEQTLQSMMKVTNVTTASPALMTEYNGRYGSLAAGNDLGMANGPLMLGSTSLAGEVCNSLLVQEKAITDVTLRNFFGGINFATGASSVTDAGFASSVRGMARSFWGRNENTDEFTLLQQYKTDFINGLAATARTQAASTNGLMLATCAAMLSSVEAISY